MGPSSILLQKLLLSSRNEVLFKSTRKCFLSTNLLERSVNNCTTLTMNELCKIIYFLNYAIHCLSLYRDRIRTCFLKDGKPIRLTLGQDITITIVYTIKSDEPMISTSYQKVVYRFEAWELDGTITLALFCYPGQGLFSGVIHAWIYLGIMLGVDYQWWISLCDNANSQSVV